MKVYVPADSAARAVGAEDVAARIAALPSVWESTATKRFVYAI